MSAQRILAFGQGPFDLPAVDPISGAQFVSTPDDFTKDAFGKLRVSMGFGQFDSLSQYSLENWITKITGTGTVTKVDGAPAYTLAVGGDTGDSVVVQTRHYQSYTPGKSQLILNTGNFLGAQDDVVKRIGYFDDDDGIFFEVNESGLWGVIRSSVSGSPVETRIHSSAFNIDPIDGTGPSKYSVNLSKSQIFAMDFQYLGVGRVRFGLNISGVYVPVHNFLHANLIDSTYMSTPNLPARYEITCVGDSGPAEMLKICTSVVSEGGYNPSGPQFCVNRITPVSVNAETIVIAVRAKELFKTLPNRRKAIFSSFQGLTASQNTLFRMSVHRDATELGGDWTSVNDDSSCEYSFNATITGGSQRDIACTYIAAAGGGLGGRPGESKQSLTESLNRIITFNPFTEISDVVVIYAETIGGTASNVNASVIWEEFD